MSVVVNPVDVHPGWNTLIEWLASHGMDTSPTGLLVESRQSNGAGYGLYALSSIPPSTPLFSVPASALLNKRTLTPHYPNAESLTAVQIISLHLFLNRPIGDEGCSDPLFGPYLSILPREFDSHPLTWLIKDQLACLETKQKQLLSCIPQSVMHDLVQMAGKFKADWATCSRYLRRNSVNLSRACKLHLQDGEGHTKLLDYLWAWLNVNTRCIFHRLEERRSHPDNMTLCPILDFANHSSEQPSMTPCPSEADIWDKPSPKRYGCDFGLSSPFDHPVDEGVELFLRYGMHPNRTLFTEYGFVESASEFGEEVDITIFISRLFSAQGERGQWMEDRLTEEGYWGDWTLHTAPAPAHPSYRVITALRLYCELDSSVSEGVRTKAIEVWRETFLGKREVISDANEACWRRVLLGLCEDVGGEARRQLATAEWSTGLRSWMAENIRRLWQEELRVADSVAESIRRGEVF